MPKVSDELWAKQVAIEARIADRQRFAVDRRWEQARQDGEARGITGVRLLVEAWHTLVVESLLQYMARRRRGTRPIDIDLFLRCPDLARLCKTGVQLCMQAVCDPQGLPLVKLASAIGEAAASLERKEEFEKHKPNLLRSIEKQLKKDEATMAHRERVIKAAFNRNVAGEVEGYERWTQEEKVRAGLKIITTLVQVTGRFYIGDVDRGDLDDVILYQREVKKKPLALKADDELVRQVQDHMRNDLAFVSASLLPCVIKPRRVEWGSSHIGYHTNQVPGLGLVIKRKTTRVLKPKSQVFDMVNHLNGTAWRINRRILDVVEWAWEMDNGIGDLPRNTHVNVPPPPKDIATNVEAKIAWKRVAKEVRHENATRGSKTRAVVGTLLMAKEFKDEPRFYLPHRIDFRGRCYPAVKALSPQGDDLTRGLLEFAEAKPIGERGIYWLKVHTANLWGKSKLSFDDRVAFVDSIKDVLIDCANNPMTHHEWAETNDPWQALAAAMECVGVFREGAAYMSRLPCMVDGSCNGIQHLAALSRDEVAGALVNVTPADKPQDIYQAVADVLVRLMVEATMFTNGEELIAKHFLEMVDENGNLSRSFTKKPVMVFPYGGRHRGYMKAIFKYLRENHKELLAERLPNQRKQVSWLASLMLKAVKEVVKRPAEAQQFLHEIAKIVVKCGKHVQWELPTGFTCEQRYFEEDLKQLTVSVGPRVIKVAIKREMPKMDEHREASAIAPNFVHSLDAAALCAAVCRLFKGGRAIAFMAVHDGYGTHASDMEELQEAIRSSFAELHCDNDVLMRMYDRARATLSANALKWQDDISKMPVIPDFMGRGSLDVRCVEMSKYFFS